MAKKTFLTAAFISVLLLIAMNEGYFVRLVQANPYRYERVSPPVGTIPPVISVLSPKNASVHRMKDITVAFNVYLKCTRLSSIYGIYLEASWTQGSVNVYTQNSRSPELPEVWSYNETFWDMPDGEYSLVITAYGSGGHAEAFTKYVFYMTSVSVVNFTIATPPEVSVLSPLNETYGSSKVTLQLAVDKSFSKISYVLDYQNNMTIDGNATLTDLSNGMHNVTVYAWDTAENVGSSETVTFTVDTTAPSISILSPRNQTYEVPDVVLDFELGEAAPQVSYALDGEENHLPTEGNSTLIGTTLTGLSNGEHNLTVYATDLAGNTGASETVYFTVKVPDPFPTLPVALAFVAVVVVSVVATGLLVYHMRRQRSQSS